MTRKYWSDRHDEGWLRSVNVEERCFKAFSFSFFISFRRGFTGPSITLWPILMVPHSCFWKESSWICPSHLSLTRRCFLSESRKTAVPFSHITKKKTRFKHAKVFFLQTLKSIKPSNPVMAGERAYLQQELGFRRNDSGVAKRCIRCNFPLWLQIKSRQPTRQVQNTAGSRDTGEV